MAKGPKKGSRGRQPEAPPSPPPKSEPQPPPEETPSLPPMIRAPLEGGGEVLLSRVTGLCAAGLIEGVEIRGDIYGFTLSDLELLLDLKRDTILAMIRTGELDPGDLETICYQWYRRAQNPRFTRRWPIDPVHRHLETERIRSRKRAKTRRRTYYTPDGNAKTIELPDIEDL